MVPMHAAWKYIFGDVYGGINSVMPYLLKYVRNSTSPLQSRGLMLGCNSRYPEVEDLFELVEERDQENSK